MRWIRLLTVFLFACGGTVANHGGGTEGGTDAGADSGSGGDSGSGSDSGCPQPPSEPVYACDAGLPDAQGCGPWGSMAASPRYPEGCVVTTTQEGTYCGPVTCNCTTEFTDGGAMWVCPL